MTLPGPSRTIVVEPVEVPEEEPEREGPPPAEEPQPEREPVPAR